MFFISSKSQQNWPFSFKFFKFCLHNCSTLPFNLSFSAWNSSSLWLKYSIFVLRVFSKATMSVSKTCFLLLILSLRFSWSLASSSNDSICCLYILIFFFCFSPSSFGAKAASLCLVAASTISSVVLIYLWHPLLHFTALSMMCCFQIICSQIDQTSILQESKLVVQIIETFLLSIHQEDFHQRNQGYFRIVARNGTSERLWWCFQDLWCFWTTLQDKPVPYQVSHSSYCSLGDLYCSPRWFLLFT